MKFSFIIPTYNNKVLLKNTLESLNNQTGYSNNDYEVIIVDDGSTDETKAYIEGTNKTYNIKYIYLERNDESSRSRTRNKGWKEAEGEIVIFIDSDIIIKEDYLLEIERSFSLKKDCIVIGNRLFLQEDSSKNINNIKELIKQYPFDSKNFPMLDFRYFFYQICSYNANADMFPWAQLYSCNIAVPKIWLNKVNGFDENFKEWGMEDIELGYSLYCEGLQIIINSKLEVLHQYHGKRNDLIIAESKMKGYETNIDYFLKKHPNALRTNKNIAYKLLKGELPTGLLLLGITKEKEEIFFKDKSHLKELKETLLVLSEKSKLQIVVYDYVEDTDLDIWIQVLGKTTNIIQYFPMSKQLDVKEMMIYLKNEKTSQANQNNC